MEKGSRGRSRMRKRRDKGLKVGRLRKQGKKENYKFDVYIAGSHKYVISYGSLNRYSNNFQVINLCLS